MRFLIRLIVIALVAVCLAIAGLLMLPGERIASIAQTQLSKQLGRSVTISSDTSISLYPTLGITTGPATIGTADWAKNGPLLETDSLDIGIDVAALLTGTIRVTKLQARAPRIVLERAADGRANWDFAARPAQSSVPPAPQSEPLPPQEPQATAPPETPQTSEPTQTSQTASTEQSIANDEAGQTPAQQTPAQSFDLSLDQALISDASLRFIDHAAGTDQRFDDVDLGLSWPDQGGPAVISLGVTPFEDRIEIGATVGKVMALLDGAQTPVTGTIEAAGATLTFEGAASLAPNAAMLVSLTAPDLIALMRAAGLNPDDLGLGTDEKVRVSTSVKMTFDGSFLTLRDMSLSVNDDTVAGDADVAFGTQIPRVNANLALDIKQTGALMRLAGQPPIGFGLDPGFNPSMRAEARIANDESNFTANLRNLDMALETARVSGTADIALIDGTPVITSNLLIDVPNAARTAQILGQPLDAFGLSPQIDAGLKANANTRIQGTTLRTDLTNLSARVAGASVAGRLSVAVQDGAPDISGRIAATIPSTAQLMSSLGQTAPDIPRGFGKAISADTALTFGDSKLSLSGLTVTLDQNTLTGDASVDLAGSVPFVAAKLTGGDLDFSALMQDSPGQPQPSQPAAPAPAQAPAQAASNQAAPAAPPTPAPVAQTSAPTPPQQGWSKDIIDASALSLLNADISLTASSIDLGALRLGTTNVAASIDRSRGVITLNDVRAFQGSFSGNLVANNRNGLSVGGKLAIRSVQLQDMLNTFADIDKVAGAANLDLDFLGIGNSVDTIMKSLSGSLAMSVPSGTVAGVDLESLIRQGNANARLTKFSDVRASAAIKGGVVRNSDLTGVTGRFTVAGEGHVDLGLQTLDYLITPVAKEVGTQGDIALPVRIKGPWSDPKIRPDLQAALNLENERKKLEELARQEIEREKQKLRDQAQAEADKLRARAQQEAQALEARAQQRLDEAARQAAERMAEQLRLDTAQQQLLKDQAKQAIEGQIGQGLRNLLGGN